MEGHHGAVWFVRFGYCQGRRWRFSDRLEVELLCWDRIERGVALLASGEPGPCDWAQISLSGDPIQVLKPLAFRDRGVTFVCRFGRGDDEPPALGMKRVEIVLR